MFGSNRPAVQDQLDVLLLRGLAVDILLKHILAEQLRRPVAAKELAAAIRNDVTHFAHPRAGELAGELVEKILSEAEALAKKR